MASEEPFNDSPGTYDNTQCIDTQCLDPTQGLEGYQDDDVDCIQEEKDFPDEEGWAYLVPASDAARKRYSVIKIKKETNENTAYTLGRRQKNDFKLKEPHVSGLHCSIFRQQAAASQQEPIIWVKDHSTNGTHVASRHNGAGNNYQSRKVGKIKVKKSENPKGYKPNRMMIHDGDELIIIPDQTKSGRHKHEKISFYFYVNKVRHGTIAKKYDLRQELGRGAFATVLLGIERQNGDTYAVKIIQKKKFNEKRHNTKRQDTLHDEQRIMTSIQHKGVIRIYDIQEDDETLTLVLEMARGGELFEKIIEIGKYPESRARDIFLQLLSAIEYLHAKKIAHRDLKPENILLMHPDQDEVKIADFGLSRMCGGDASMLQTVCGTPQYLAPEILENQDGKSGYGFEVDYWSMGVILYILLSGCPPFHDERKLPVLEQVKQASYNFPRKAWRGVSQEAIDMVKHLILKDAKKRYQGAQIRQHPWVTGKPLSAPPTTILGSRQRETMQKFTDADLPMPSAKRSRIFPGPSSAPRERAHPHKPPPIKCSFVEPKKDEEAGTRTVALKDVPVPMSIS